MPVTVEKITDQLLLGEGPHWDDRQQALFFVDILNCSIHKYHLATKQHTKTKLGGRVGFIVPVEGTTDQFLVGLERTFTIVQWDGGEGSPATVVRELGTVDADVVPPTRINDGKADPKGRIFGGTMGHEEPLGNIKPASGSLYRVDGGGVTKLCGDIGISNGLAWDLQRKAFYYTDTFEFNIRQYDYDVDTGEISNPKHIFDFKRNNIDAYPDGSTIDTDGNLWIALFKGDGVIQIDPTTGKLLQKVNIPAHQVTSVTFGGPNFDILFVTSASMKLLNEEEQKPPRGCTFMVTGLGVKGLPNNNFKLPQLVEVGRLKMSAKVEKITDQLLLGEGPHWDDRQQALFFVDIRNCSIHKYHLATKQHTKTKLGGRVGFIVPVEGTTDQFLVGLERTFTIVQWDGGEGSPATVVRELGTVDANVVPLTRINDGKADPRGRIFAGTMGYEGLLGNIKPINGSLYRLDGGGVTKLCGGIGISNGLAFDLQRKAFYYTDTIELNIRRYDYDVDTGEISNPKHIFDLKKNNIDAYPDGSTIDTDGNLWIALFKGDGVIKIDPTTGKLLQKVNIPAHQVTSVTFGGPNFDILFVTSASMKLLNEEEQKPPRGCTFMVTGLGVKGLPNNNFKLP
nr:uncharacterized protein LOC117986645 [Maniola hyperantus]